MVRPGCAAWLVDAREAAVIRAVDHVRLGLPLDHRLVDDDLGDVPHRGQLVHGVEQHRLENRAQPAGTGLSLHGAMRYRAQRLVAELELSAFHLEQAPVLLGERVLRLGEDRDQRALVELIERRHDRQAADELRDQPVLDEILGLDVVEQVAAVRAGIDAAHFGRKPDAAFLRAVENDLLETGERPSADEQDVAGVDLQELLLRVLATTLGRHGCDGPFDQLQQRLLYAFAGHIARDRGVIGLARDLIDLVDVNDAGLGFLDVVIALLQQLLNDVLDVLTDITGFGERGRVGDGERHIQQSRQRLRQQRLAAPGRSDEQDIALGDLDLFFGAPATAAARLQPLVVVVDGHRKHLFCAFLADDVLVEDLLDLVGLGELVARTFGAVLELLADDVVAQLDAFVAHEHRGTGDQLANLVLALPAERAIEQLAVVVAAAGIFTHRRASRTSRRATSPATSDGRVSYSTVSGRDAKSGRTPKSFCARNLYDVVHLFDICRPAGDSMRQVMQSFPDS